jgi:hypothetical protein
MALSLRGSPKVESAGNLWDIAQHGGGDFALPKGRHALNDTEQIAAHSEGESDRYEGAV